MTCTNCDCPFYELQAEDGPIVASEFNCVVTDAVKQVNFSAGETLFAQGQSSSNLFALNSGMVKITSNAADGREQIVGLSTPGRLLVGLQSIGQEHYGYSAIAATDGNACKIRHRALLTALVEHAEIAMRLITALNAQLAHSRSLMEVMGHKTAAAKIASFILLLAPKVRDYNERFTLPFSRNDMADLLGLSEETVCRQMADMRRNGVLYAPRGKMQIKDWGQLRAIANGLHA
jgi:CRP/FNR family transcriptional regulator